MSLAPRRIAAALFIALALAGCEKPGITQQGHAAEASAKPDAAQVHASTLAITRSVDIELAPEAIAPAFASARAACEAEGADACVLLEASLTSGESPSAKIRLRAPSTSNSRPRRSRRRSRPRVPPARPRAPTPACCSKRA